VKLFNYKTSCLKLHKNIQQLLTMETACLFDTGFGSHTTPNCIDGILSSADALRCNLPRFDAKQIAVHNTNRNSQETHVHQLMLVRFVSVWEWPVKIA
jgi:hypothetical protein